MNQSVGNNGVQLAGILMLGAIGIIAIYVICRFGSSTLLNVTNNTTNTTTISSTNNQLAITSASTIAAAAVGGIAGFLTGSKKTEDST